MEYNIIRSKSCIIVTPYNKNQSKALERMSTQYDRVYHSYKETSGFLIQNYEGKSAYLTIDKPIDFLQYNFPTYNIINREPVKPIKIAEPFSMNPEIALRPAQESIASQLLSSRAREREWFINLQTGQGKTLLSVYLSSIFATKTLILCFSTDILRQWITTYETKTNIDTDRICLLSSSKMLEDIRSGDFDIDAYDIYLSTPGLWTSYAKKQDYAYLDEIFRKIGFGLMIVDEAHRNLANIIKLNACTNVWNSIYLSADFAQGNVKNEKAFYSLYRKAMILTPSEEEKKTMKYTKVIVVQYNTHPSQTELLSINNAYGYSAENYMTYQLRKPDFFKALDTVISSILKTNDHHRILILLTHIAHVDKVTAYLQEKYAPVLSVGRFHGEVSLEERERTRNEADLIVATYKSFGTGIDTEAIKYIVSTNQSNKVEDNQAAGRARPLEDGSDAVYFMITDAGFPYCVSKLGKRLAYLKETKLKEAPHIVRIYDTAKLF